MNEVSDLLVLAKSVAVNACSSVLEETEQEHMEFVFSNDQAKEVKALVDKKLEQYILRQLIPTGLSILTEESGYLPNKKDSKYHFIVDPLDGTFNFVKDLGPCAVSIALWEDKRPVFGVIFDLQKQQSSHLESHTHLDYYSSHIHATELQDSNCRLYQSSATESECRI